MNHITKTDQMTHRETLKKLILIRLFCLPNSLLVAKKQEIAHARIYEQIKRDLLKLFNNPDPNFVVQFRILLQESLKQHFQFSGTLLQLSTQAKQEAIDFLGLSGQQRAIKALTWEQVRTVHLIALILELPPKQHERVKNEGKLQASILVRFHSRLGQHDVVQGSLAQVARELARLAIASPSSRMGDLKKTLLAHWTQELMLGFLKESNLIPSMISSMNSANITTIDTAHHSKIDSPYSPEYSLTKGQVLSNEEKKNTANARLVQFAEQIKTILHLTPNNCLLIFDIWQEWKNKYKSNSDLTTFKQILIETHKRNLLTLLSISSTNYSSAELKKSELFHDGHIYHSIK